MCFPVSDTAAECQWSKGSACGRGGVQCISPLFFYTSCVSWMTLGESLGQKGILNDPDSAKQGHVTTIFIQKSSGDFFESFRNVPCCVCLACCILALVALVASAGFSWIVCVQNQKFMCKTISSLHSTHVQKASISPQVPQVQKPNLIKFASSASGFFWMFLAYREATDNHFPMKAHDKDPVRVRIFGSKQLALFPTQTQLRDDDGNLKPWRLQDWIDT